jgi:hypothetical protein
VPLIKRHRSLTEAGCTYIFWSDRPVPKDVIALISQRLAAANNMLHCFSLLPAKSARWIPIKQAHSTQVPSHRSMSCENRNCHLVALLSATDTKRIALVLNIYFRVSSCLHKIITGPRKELSCIIPPPPPPHSSPFTPSVVQPLSFYESLYSDSRVAGSCLVCRLHGPGFESQ